MPLIIKPVFSQAPTVQVYGMLTRLAVSETETSLVSEVAAALLLLCQIQSVCWEDAVLLHTDTTLLHSVTSVKSLITFLSRRNRFTLL